MFSTVSEFQQKSACFTWFITAGSACVFRLAVRRIWSLESSSRKYFS